DDGHPAAREDRCRLERDVLRERDQILGRGANDVREAAGEREAELADRVRAERLAARLTGPAAPAADEVVDRYAVAGFHVAARRRFEHDAGVLVAELKGIP